MIEENKKKAGSPNKEVERPFLFCVGCGLNSTRV
jgi:hypothetical protein